MFDDDPNARIISRQLLKNLPRKNKLKPPVWAECKTAPVVYYGVSLGVRNFVRPLYLLTKLRQLPNLENVPQVENRLQDVKAYTMKKNDDVKEPCITCQRYFGFISFPIIGNCAEYDVIGKVDSNLPKTQLEKQEWQKFESACQQHLDAFNAMMEEIKRKEIRREEISPEEIIKRYFKNIRIPGKPKVLKYQWSPTTMGGFQVVAIDWPLPKTREQR